MGFLIEMIGQKFSRLLVVSRAAKREGESRAYWLCKCDCGTEEIAVSGKALRSGATRSCGCLGVEWATHMGSNSAFVAKRAEKRVRHGHKRKDDASAEYKTWLRIKSRCSRLTDKDYANWGGRGIRVCPEWASSFERFLADMGPMPSPTHTIDRMNSNRNYEQGNCRWAPHELQGAENRRTLVAVVVDGQRFHSMAAAARHFGVPRSTASERVRAGIPLHEAVSIPVRGAKSRRSRESYLPKSHPDRVTQSER